ncbi:tyrosine-type recombinase/integrase [Achromobacter insuavis]
MLVTPVLHADRAFLWLQRLVEPAALGGHWTQHDLRRTGATIMGELGISSDVIDLCLNHKKAKKTTRTYQRQTMLPQRRDAFDALSDHLTKLLAPLRTGFHRIVSQPAFTQSSHR